MFTSAKAKTAIMVAVLIAIVIAALGWFLLISPKFEEAAEIQDEAEILEDKNKIEAKRIEDLKVRYARIDELRAEIAEYQVGIPDTAKIAEFSDYIAAEAIANEVFLSELGFQPGVLITANNEPALPPTLQAEREAQAAAEAEAAAAKKKDDDDTESSGTSAPASAPLIEGFYGIQNNITVIGPKDNALAFLAALQAKSARNNLVYEYTLTSLAEAEGNSGKPDTEIGDVELQITGMIYVLQDILGIIEQPEEVVTPLQPSGERNPFVPLPENLGEAGATSTGGQG